MQFFTQVPINNATYPINYRSKIISIGSCFAENMGEKLHYFQFQNTINPFGNIFNSTSIEKLIIRALRNEYFTENDLFFHNERWHCFEVHSDLSNVDKNHYLFQLNQILTSFLRAIQSSTHFIITLGTSWVYRSIDSNEIVANCHKIPQKQFLKYLLSGAEISSSLQNIVAAVKEINPDCQFIFTISPVRHIKDGFVENQISKANLISAVHDAIANQNNGTNLNYFPSYEIMMDELRDYRFYNQDLLHPNQTAIDYIWSKFVETNIDAHSTSTMIEVNAIRKGLQHRSFHPDSVAHKNFITQLNQKINHLQKSYPFMNFDNP